ncbi:MAG: hypothetical protein Q7Q73_10485 [Verrucomicrobiota bacterium JB024]|nr:hypothetical protein [Verrucomicrobiota bacterium JB024]
MRHPFELFADPLKDTLTRIAAYVLVMALGAVLASFIFELVEVGKIGGVELRALFLIPLVLLYLAVTGILQGWGVLSYLVLAGFGGFFVFNQMRYRWLLLPFIVQGAEVLRQLYAAIPADRGIY